MEYIYRIENSDGLGPYRTDPIGLLSSLRHRDATIRPHPVQDPLLQNDWREIWSKEILFGFASLQQLLIWFSIDELMRLNIHGYKVIKIPINEIKYYKNGTNQLIFKKR